MADLPNTVPVVTALPSSGDAPQSRTLVGGNNIQLQDSGAGNSLVIEPIDNLGALSALSTLGITCRTGASTFANRTITSGGTINITNPAGTAGNIILDMVADSTRQRVSVLSEGILVGTVPQLNFVSGDGVGMTIIQNANTMDITISSDTTSALDAKYILQQPAVELPNAQALSTLATGLVFNTTTTGVLNTISGWGSNGHVLTSNGTGAAWAAPATSGTVTSVDVASNTGLLVTGGPITASGTIDVELPGTGLDSAVTEGDLLVGNGAGAYAGLAVGTTGQVLTSDGTTASWADAAGPSADAYYVVASATDAPTNAQDVNALDSGLLITTKDGVAPGIAQIDSIPNPPTPTPLNPVYVLAATEADPTLHWWEPPLSSNPSGIATLSGGSVVVSVTGVTPSSYALASYQSINNPGILYVTPGTDQITIQSTNALDASDVAWEVLGVEAQEIGEETLVGGTATVMVSGATVGTPVLVTYKTLANPGILSATISAPDTLTITSTNASDTSTVMYSIG